MHLHRSAKTTFYEVDDYDGDYWTSRTYEYNVQNCREIKFDEYMAENDIQDISDILYHVEDECPEIFHSQETKLAFVAMLGSNLPPIPEKSKDFKGSPEEPYDINPALLARLRERKPDWLD